MISKSEWGKKVSRLSLLICFCAPSAFLLHVVFALSLVGWLLGVCVVFGRATSMLPH